MTYCCSCVTVGRVVASDIRDPQFEPHKPQKYSSLTTKEKNKGNYYTYFFPRVLCQSMNSAYAPQLTKFEAKLHNEGPFYSISG